MPQAYLVHLFGSRGPPVAALTIAALHPASAFAGRRMHGLLSVGDSGVDDGQGLICLALAENQRWQNPDDIATHGSGRAMSEQQPIADAWWGDDVLLSLSDTISMPSMSPMPRTSPTISWRRIISSNSSLR